MAFLVEVSLMVEHCLTELSQHPALLEMQLQGSPISEGGAEVGSALCPLSLAAGVTPMVCAILVTAPPLPSCLLKAKILEAAKSLLTE